MPDPTRPVAGAAVATDWGQAVHDATFAPKGTRVAGGVASTVNETLEQLNLNTAIDDPGGWLASDALTVPAGAGGIYDIFIRWMEDNGDADDETRLVVKINGTEAFRDTISNEGALQVFKTVGSIEELAAGDVITVWARKVVDTGDNPDVIVVEMWCIRRASELGA